MMIIAPPLPLMWVYDSRHTGHCIPWSPGPLVSAQEVLVTEAELLRLVLREEARPLLCWGWEELLLLLLLLLVSRGRTEKKGVKKGVSL